MERMSPLEAEFLDIEDDVAHMHMASCSIFAGPAPSFDSVLEAFETALSDLPRYRQRVELVPLGLGRPVWVDDSHFSLEYHVRHSALPPPGSDEELRALMGRLTSLELDRRRPLWEVWIVEGLADGRWAAVSKVHHCMVDGIAGTDLAMATLDTEPEPEPERPPAEPDAWEPARVPSGPELVVDAWFALLGDVWRVARAVPGALLHPSGVLRGVGQVGHTITELRGGDGAEHRVTSIDGPIGPHRRYDWVSLPLDDVRSIKNRFGGTVNDVVLAAVTHGFRVLLESRGEPVEGVVLRTLVPVSMRAEDERGLADNRVSAVMADLPVGLADPRDRLDNLRVQMSQLKESHEAEAAELFQSVAELAPHFLLSTATKVVFGQANRNPGRLLDTVVTNVPGPQFTLYSLGRQMLEWMPFVPIAPGVQIGVAVLSYDGLLTFGLTGDYDGATDLRRLAEGIEEGVAVLDELTFEPA